MQFVNGLTPAPSLPCTLQNHSRKYQGLLELLNSLIMEHEALQTQCISLASANSELRSQLAAVRARSNEATLSGMENEVEWEWDKAIQQATSRAILLKPPTVASCVSTDELLVHEEVKETGADAQLAEEKDRGQGSMKSASSTETDINSRLRASSPPVSAESVRLKSQKASEDPRPTSPTPGVSPENSRISLKSQKAADESRRREDGTSSASWTDFGEKKAIHTEQNEGRITKLRKSVSFDALRVHMAAIRNSLDPAGDASPGRAASRRSIGKVKQRSCVLKVLEDAVRSPWFENFFNALTFMNTLLLCLEVQYVGFDTGLAVRFPGMTRSSAETWPWCANFLKSADIAFGSMYCVELLLKVFVFRFRYLTEIWNLVDGFVVLAWLTTSFTSLTVLVDPMFLRLLRLGRFLRVLRLVHTIQALDQLNLMIQSIKASLPVLMWSMLLIVTLHVGFSLVINEFLESYLLDESNPLADRQEVYGYYGTFTLCQITMFELTMGNWIPPCRVLMERVDEKWGVFFLCYKCMVGFAIMKVISGIFLHETFKCAATDDDIMIMMKQRAFNNHCQKMTKLLNEADSSGDGCISEPELVAILNNPSVKMWLAAQELEVRDVPEFFKLMDDGDGTVQQHELIQKMAHMKGSARSTDLLTLIRKHDEMQDCVRRIMDMVSCTPAAHQ